MPTHTPTHSPTDVLPARTRAGLIVGAALFIGGLAGVSTLAAAAAAPASRTDSIAAIHQGKLRATPSASPTAPTTSSATASPSPMPTLSPAPAPTSTPTTSPAPEPGPSPSEAPSPPPPPPPPDTSCTTGTAVPFEGSLYCSGEIVGVQNGTYGLNSRVVLQGMTVLDVTGSTVGIMGGPSCLPDPTTEPRYCAAVVATMAVDFTGAVSMPAPGTGIDLYGVTDASGGIKPVGSVTVAWCDPDWCP